MIDANPMKNVLVSSARRSRLSDLVLGLVVCMIGLAVLSSPLYAGRRVCHLCKTACVTCTNFPVNAGVVKVVWSKSCVQTGDSYSCAAHYCASVSQATNAVTFRGDVCILTAWLDGAPLYFTTYNDDGHFHYGWFDMDYQWDGCDYIAAWQSLSSVSVQDYVDYDSEGNEYHCHQVQTYTIDAVVVP